MTHPKAIYKEGVHVAHVNAEVTITLDLGTATTALMDIREQIAEAFRADTPMACVAALRAVDELASAALAKCNTGPRAPEWEYPPLPAEWVRKPTERSCMMFIECPDCSNRWLCRTHGELFVQCPECHVAVHANPSPSGQSPFCIFDKSGSCRRYERCTGCGWPLMTKPEYGCVPGDCVHAAKEEQCNADDKFLRERMDAARRHEELAKAAANPPDLGEYMNTRTLPVDVAAQMYGVPRKVLTAEPDADTPVIVEKASE